MKVLLVDDHPLILSALQTMIQELDPDVRVTAVGSAAAARTALASAEVEFDLVLLDLQLGDASGFDVLIEMRKAHPALPVVVISASDRASDVIQAIDLGAMGFVPKRASNDTLVEALRLVMAGGIYVPAMHLGSNAGGGHGRSHLPAIPAAEATTYQVQPSFEELGLTPRQADVLTQLLQGKPNKEIARRLGLSVETVKDHVQAVLRALGVSSRTQAVLAVSQMTQQRLERRAAQR
jgi:DNA-binding NarL/FixJ family response regulator